VAELSLQPTGARRRPQTGSTPPTARRRLSSAFGEKRGVLSMVRSPRDDNLPSLDDVRPVLRIGMTRGELFDACDELLGRHQLRVSLPDLPNNNVVGIHVAEGDALLCFLIEDRLTYVEYRGDVFLGGD
jgi:hypothetical protein